MHGISAVNGICLHGFVFVVWVLNVEKHLIMCLGQAFHIGDELFINGLLLLEYEIKLFHGKRDILNLNWHLM